MTPGNDRGLTGAFGRTPVPDRPGTSRPGPDADRDAGLAHVLAIARQVVAERLTERWGDLWYDDGTVVRGPDDLAIEVAPHPGYGPRHVDLGFVLNTGPGDSTVIWDCAHGDGPVLEHALSRAVDTWCVTTGMVFMEFLTQHGRFAQHMPHDDDLGLPGWHVIHGPPYAWGKGQGPGELQTWWRENSVLPELGPVLAKELDWGSVNGVRISFSVNRGRRTAEVLVNRRRSELASRWLEELEWPEPVGPAAVRSFVLISRPQ